MFRLLLFLLLVSFSGFSQSLSKSDKKLIKSLKENITFLSSDALEGRRAGSQGEELAANFISDKFKSIGLIPQGSINSYFQHFTINDGKKILPETFLSINNTLLKSGTDFFPISNSSNSVVIQSQLSISLKEKNQPWVIDLSDDLSLNTNNPHFDLNTLLQEKINNAYKKGASTVIFINSSSINDNISFDTKDKAELTPIPAIYLTNASYTKYFKDDGAFYDIQFRVSIGPSLRNTKNVIGFIDNNRPLTIILGSHFDHLGYGEDGNSMLRTGEHLIHNGADDNASGTAALIELARIFKSSKSNKYNYLFIAFSAEELGLNGSKYFVENPTISLNSVNYMINMDMVGRMNDSTKSITIGGYGTSPSWNAMIDKISNKPFKFRFDSSGSGPSDHTSFYRKDIPVLFFFTGLHTDYHKPTDDSDKINYVGESQIIRFIQNLIEQDKESIKLAFSKTREQQSSTSSRFSVSMGIMPDYTFSGNGVLVDGVSEGRPAKKVGILAGDIVKQLGDYKTSSVESYMQALSHFKKGEKTTVSILRGENIVLFEIIF